MNAEYYIKKQNSINKAIERVNKKLIFFESWTEENLYKNYDKMKEEERKYVREKIKSFNWNLYHDLEDRLKNRLKENYFNYQNWHFESFGWCAY